MCLLLGHFTGYCTHSTCTTKTTVYKNPVSLFKTHSSVPLVAVLFKIYYVVYLFLLLKQTFYWQYEYFYVCSMEYVKVRSTGYCFLSIIYVIGIVGCTHDESIRRESQACTHWYNVAMS